MTEIIQPNRAPSPELLTPANVQRLGRESVNSSGLLVAGNEPTQLALLQELEPVVERELNRHNRQIKLWTPADFLPIDDEGRILHRHSDPDESPLLSPEVYSAMLVNLLTEDNLPAYHRVIANNFGLDGAWGTWVNQWTAEEDNHAYVMRSFLDLTRAINPQLLESHRREQMLQGYNVEKDPLHTLVYVTFQELATRVSHRNTGIKSDNDIADQMLARIAQDENMHMLFYRNLVAAALDIAPNQTMQAIYDEIVGFEMPGSNIDGFRRHALTIANADIYNLPLHLNDVVMPILKMWKIFKRDDFTGYGAEARDNLAAYLVALEGKASKFTELQQMRRDRSQNL